MRRRARRDAQPPRPDRKLVQIAAAITSDDRQGVIPRDKLDTLAMPVIGGLGHRRPGPALQPDAGPAAGFVLHEVANAGHMLVEEAPDLVAEIIERAMR